MDLFIRGLALVVDAVAKRWDKDSPAIRHATESDGVLYSELAAALADLGMSAEQFLAECKEYARHHGYPLPALARMEQAAEGL